MGEKINSACVEFFIYCTTHSYHHLVLYLGIYKTMTEMKDSPDSGGGAAREGRGRETGSCGPVRGKGGPPLQGARTDG